MKGSRLLWATLLAVALTACSQRTTTGGSTTESAAGDTSAPAAAAKAPAAAGAPAASAGTTVQESTNVDDGADRGEKALENMAQLPASAQLPGGKWVAGKSYQPISPAQPTDSGAGRVEVIEMFWYACPHCYELDPVLENWRKSGKPAYVDFVRVPVTWDTVHQTHARLFYTLQALGKEEQLHAQVFQAIHDRTNLLVGDSDEESLKLQVQFAKAHGIGETDFVKARSSPSVDLDMQRAGELVRRYRVEGVPMIIINGKYSTDVGQAGGDTQLISLINDLAASEHRR